jgi:nucleoside-diphosphate-sugar epimerase
MKALITGAAGFVGRHMARELVRRGWDIDGWDITVGRNALDLFYGDSPVYDLVIHAAYHVGGRAAIDTQPRLLAMNMHLDAAMFEWALQSQRRVLYFSSSAAYPVALQTGEFETRLAEDDIDLDDVAQPDARYGWAKLSGEQLARAANEMGLPVYVVRPFSGYAEDQDLSYPFPSIIQRARNGDPTVWGPPGQTRIHIDDVVAGALAVVDAEEVRPVNLCTGVGTEFGDLMRLAAGVADVDVKYQIDKPTGVRYRVGDPARMNEYYTAKISIEEGVARAFA